MWFFNGCNKYVKTWGDFQSVNVLEDQNIREGIKVFSDWPTIPQLYIKKNL